jgi:xanthine dehydrogenase accessory factor
MSGDIFLRIAELRKNGKSFSLATLVYSEESTPRKAGSRMIIYPDGNIEGSIGGGALEKKVIEDAKKNFKEGRTGKYYYNLSEKGEGVRLGMICGGKAEVLIETFNKTEQIFIFGSGHIGRKLSQLSRAVEMPYWMIDNREEFSKKEMFPDAVEVVCADFKDSFSKLPIDESSYIIIVTYGHKHDNICLEKALETDAKYIGMIGSRRKVKKILEELSAKGLPVDDPRVFAPIGLELGDNTPGEIAVSIFAELLKIKSGGSAKHMRNNQLS